MVADPLQRIPPVFQERPEPRSLGTKSKSFLQYNPDGSLTLYFGAKSPGKDKETNWVPAPDGTFSLYLRGYWADKSILDGSWMLPNVEQVNDLTNQLEERI